jgi:hypothetical protein
VLIARITERTNVLRMGEVGGGNCLGGGTEGHGNESSDSVKVRGLLVPERLTACRELCSVELQRTVNIALFTTAPVFLCHSVEL